MTCFSSEFVLEHLLCILFSIITSRALKQTNHLYCLEYWIGITVLGNMLIFVASFQCTTEFSNVTIPCVVLVILNEAVWNS